MKASKLLLLIFLALMTFSCSTDESLESKPPISADFIFNIDGVDQYFTARFIYDRKQSAM